MLDPRTVVAAACLAALCPAQKPDLEAAERELYQMFERPEGTRITPEAKQSLAAFVERHKDHDLAHLGYVIAMNEYLSGRTAEAAVALDEFFEHHDTIAHAEHRKMAGRIYYNAVWRGAPSKAKLELHAERWARLYDDTALILRVVPRLAERLPEDDARALRIGLARGVLATDASYADKDNVLQTLFAATKREGAAASASPRAVPAARIRATKPAAAAPSHQQAAAVREALTGTAAPAIETVHVVGADAFSLEAMKGKVVVLDFTATWCGPCRNIVDEMIALQDKHEGKVQVVGVTRLYGRGVDFSGPDAKIPHQGKSVRDLDQAGEIAINEKFVAAFGIDYPMVIAKPKIASEKYGVTGIPSVFVIGRDGTVVGHVVGASDASHQKLVALVESAL